MGRMLRGLGADLRRLGIAGLCLLVLLGVREIAPLVQARLAPGVCVRLANGAAGTWTQAFPVVVENRTEEAIVFGHAYVLERWENGGWRRLDVMGDAFLYAHLARPHEAREITYPLRQGAEPRRPGVYRLGVPYSGDIARPRGDEEPLEKSIAYGVFWMVM